MSFVDTLTIGASLLTVSSDVTVPICSCIAPVSIFFVVTIAPGTAAPEASVTMPFMLADTCACAVGNNAARRSAIRAMRHTWNALGRAILHSSNFAAVVNNRHRFIVKSSG